MIVAIDDTYGQSGHTASKYVTHDRRTHVGVVFQDGEVNQIRADISELLKTASKLLGLENPLKEFHFTEIYNKRGAWKNCPEGGNLAVVEFFAEYYSNYRWPVLIQTIDDRTLPNNLLKNIQLGKLDLKKREHISLLFLLFKFRTRYRHVSEPSHILIDEGIGKVGTDLGIDVFPDWLYPIDVKFQSSQVDPILQIADFIAFCINRSTHLALKPSRSDTDLAFLDLVGSMNINADEEDFSVVTLQPSFSVQEFDAIHTLDRVQKGLE